MLPPKCAIISGAPCICEVAGTMPPWLVSALDRMLFAGSESCFRQEREDMRSGGVEVVQDIIKKGGTAYLWCERGRVVGCCLVHKSNMSHFCIASDSRGKGTGRRFMRAVLRLHPKLTLSVWKRTDNPSLPARLIRFYRSMGLCVRGERGQYVAMSTDTDHLTR